MGQRILLSFNLVLVLGIFSACAQKPPLGMQDYDQNSQAHGAAYVSDNMTVRTPMPSNSDWKPLEFYFKHCSNIGDETYYSKSTYECTGP